MNKKRFTTKGRRLIIRKFKHHTHSHDNRFLQIMLSLQFTFLSLPLVLILRSLLFTKFFFLFNFVSLDSLVPLGTHSDLLV